MILPLSILLPIILLYLLKKHRKPTPNTPSPPGPPGLPLIGNLHQIATAKYLHIYLRQLSDKYGPIIQMKLGSVPLIVISSPKLAKQVLKTQDLAFCSRPKLLGQQMLSYNGMDIVFSPYNASWKELRKLTLTHLLSIKKIQSFRPIREDEISRLVAKIARFASSGEVVDVSAMAGALGSTLICRIAFGKRYDEDGDEMRRFEGLLEDVEVMAAGFSASDYFPMLSWVDRITGLISRFDAICKRLDSFYEELIDEHLDPRRTKMEEGDDILDILIQLKEEKSFSFDLKWDHIKALLMDIFIAGSDASSAAAVWTMTALVKAPNVMQKVQSEIRNFIGKKGKVDEDDLQKLPYLKAVIYETLRLYPVAPLLVPRETLERCILEGYEIKPKTVVYVNAWAIARDPEYWDNADEFLPERFLDNDIDIKGQDFGVLPFGSGRRICPGMFMGLANLELTVANLVYGFDWEFPPGVVAEDVDTDRSPGIAANKKNPLLLVPKKYCV